MTMHKQITRLVVLAAACGTAVSLLGMAGAGGSGQAAWARQARAPAFAVAGAEANPGAQLWVTRYSGPGGGADMANSMAVSPDGRTVYVTGYSAGKTSAGDGASDYATVAYSAATGAQLWARRYNGPGSRMDGANSVAVSPDGRTVFVTGMSTGKTTGGDYATIAYRAATGARLWVRRYTTPGDRWDSAGTVAAGPGGRTVFVTGLSTAKASGNDYLTIAYRAGTGATLWVRRWTSPGNVSDGAGPLAVSRDGSRVFVTGFSGSPGTLFRYDAVTVAYQASSGKQLWVRRYNGPGNGDDAGGSVAVGPGGRTVYVTGSSAGKTSRQDYATIAYRASTGRQRWVRRYNGPLNSDDYPAAMQVGPAGRQLYVTGSTGGEMSPRLDYATVAYTAAGKRLWVKRYNGPASRADGASSLAVSPDGRTLYVTGSSTSTRSGTDYATIAYRTATGAQLWLRRWTGSGTRQDSATNVKVAPGGRRVFVTGLSRSGTTDYDYITVGYGA
jgi:sugar lactone lactonase YvrE